MSMSDYALEAEEEYYDDWAISAEQEHNEFFEALHYIEEFKAIVINEDDYVDLLLAEEKIIEYQEVYVNYEHNSTNELKTKIDSLEIIIIDISKKLMEQLPSIPTAEKKLITAKEFEELYSMNIDAQLKYRNRKNDPLPHIQIVENGNILYDCIKIGKWLENYEK